MLKCLPNQVKTGYAIIVEESLKMRKQKALDRRRDRRLLAKVKSRVEEISLAASVSDRSYKSPLILRRVKIPEHEIC